MSDATRAVERLWDGTGLAARVGRVLLAPAAGLYAAGIGVRNAAYGVGVLRSRAAAVRTVSIGNIRVGGTGKTPFTRWLAGARSGPRRPRRHPHARLRWQRARPARRRRRHARRRATSRARATRP